MSDKALILITVPAYQWLWSEHDTLHHHVRRYSKKTLKEKLNVSGFRVKYISYFNNNEINAKERKTMLDAAPRVILDKEKK